MRLKHVLQEVWYFHAAMGLFGVTALAYGLSWVFSIGVIAIVLERVYVVFGSLVTTTLILLALLVMWVFRYQVSRLPLCLAPVKRILGAPARYGDRLLNHITQEKKERYIGRVSSSIILYN